MNKRQRKKQRTLWMKKIILRSKTFRSWKEYKQYFGGRDLIEMLNSDLRFIIEPYLALELI